MYEVVLNEINKQITNYYDIGLIEKNYNEQRKLNSLENEIKILYREKNEIERSITRKENSITLLYEDRLDGIIDLAEFQIIKNKKNVDIQNLRERLNRHK